MSPERLHQRAADVSTVMNSEQDRFNSADMKTPGSNSGSRHPSSYPGALSDTAQIGGTICADHPTTCSDALSGHFSVDEFSLPLSDNENPYGHYDKLSAAETHDRASSDEADESRWQRREGYLRPVEIKLCIEKEYIHVINVDHSRLDEELANRTAMVAMLGTVSNSNSLRTNTAGGLMPVERKTPMTGRSSARKMLTGESIRKLFRIMSPASRRHRTAEVHSSGSSVSGDTLTGSKSSLAIDSELPSNASHAVEPTKYNTSTDSDSKPDKELPSGSGSV